MNDRQLRFIADGLGGAGNGTPREDGFDITVASEVMAVFCLASDISDLKARLSKMVIGYTYENKPVFAADLNAHGAMTALLKDALWPNLVQTLEGTPAIIHGGPFANIAHGCNSIIATKTARYLGEYCVTEAGFGADLGAQKYLDIKCRADNDLVPDAVCIVATIRALAHHGGAKKEDLNRKDALKKGIDNLLRHADNIKTVYNLPCVVALNRFVTDTEAEINLVRESCAALGISTVLSEVWEKGSLGGALLAEEIIRLCNLPSDFSFSHVEDEDVLDKLNKICKRVYRANGVILTAEAEKQLARLREFGFGSLPVCVAKTQYSFSDDAKKLAAPEDFYITVRNLKVSAGAGFVVALTGDIMTMPGLPKVPAAEKIDVDSSGKITNLF